MKAPSQQQTESSVRKNISFFRDRRASYADQVRNLDTYVNIRASTNEALRGINRLLDIGNGGTFDYDASLVRELVAVDLFLEDLAQAEFPPNVIARNGSALDIPEADAAFDGVVMSMLIHHLVGTTVSKCRSNVSRAIAEAFRVLKPGGKLVVVESCVPGWFYGFENLVFPVASRLIPLCVPHPATLQFPPSFILGLIESHTSNVTLTPIPLGRWVIQYGFKYPSVLTPAAPFRFVAIKRN